MAKKGTSGITIDTWKTKMVVLDVALRTGDLSIELQHDSAAKVIGTDFCRPMLAIALEKNQPNNLDIPYVEGDVMKLSFADDKFDALTIAFGLRNLANFAGGLSEFHRVLKPGGKSPYSSSRARSCRVFASS